MAKPTEGLPQWNENETNVIDPPSTYKTDGWGLTEKPPSQYFNYWMNLVYKWILWVSTILGGNRTVIDSQAKFDAYFDGSGTKTGNIYLAEVGIVYQHSNPVVFGSNFVFDGDRGVLVERANVAAKFSSTGTPDNVLFSDNVVYDGKKATYPLTTNGGFADITGCTNSRFETRVKDCETSLNGGAYFATGDTTSGNTIKNIETCEATNGSGVYGVYGSDVSDIIGCIGDVVQNCYKSVITKIHDNFGSAVQACHGSVINTIYSNTTGVSGSDECNIYNVFLNGVGVTGSNDSNISNVYKNNFDGVTNCFDCKISDVYKNGVISSGTGVSGCVRSTIDNIHDNPEGGCIACDESTMSNIHDNASTSASIAGGCHNCSNAVFTGTFIGNTSPGTYDHISDCLTSMAFSIGDGTTSFKISAARETVNF